MAGGGVQDNPNLKGLSRIFNAETNFGRANVRKIIIRLYEPYHQKYQPFLLFHFILWTVRQGNIRSNWSFHRLQIAETKAKAVDILS